VANIFIYLLGKRLFGAPIAFVALVVANITPLFSAGSIIMTMDPPQLAIWAAALYVIHFAVSSADGDARRPGLLRSLPLWLLAGVLAGLAAQAKIYALLLLPSLLVFLA